jgi:hypothetical protein
VLLSVLMFPAMVIRYNMGWYEMMIVDVPLFLGATMSVCSFYVMSQREAYGESWKSRIKYLPMVLAVGIGLSVNNAKAVLEAVFGMESEFKRTPKYRVEGAPTTGRKRYREPELSALRRAAVLPPWRTTRSRTASGARTLHPALPVRLPTPPRQPVPGRGQAGGRPRAGSLVLTASLTA